MKTVYKYTLRPGLNTITMPASAQIISVGVDGDDQFCCWALLDPEDPDRVVKNVAVHGTGWHFELPAIKCFLGTVVTKTGLVWHCWEV